jgi:gliding motility-associated-like protein
MNLRKDITLVLTLQKLNNFKSKQIFILLFLGISLLAEAQIPSPDLYCIKNDTLQWAPPSVTCGAVTGYEIYFSEFKTGPYTLLTTITDLSKSFYFHSTFSKNYYYYMTTLANCPGQVSESSDTLDNFDPPVIPIESVNVVGGKSFLTWKIPVSNKQLSYIIYRTTPNGTLPIDTVSNTNTFLDISSNPQSKSESYYILSLDLCGNASIYDLPHYSIYSEIALDYCKRELKVKWTKYQNWANGVKEYQIWTGINGASATVIDTIDAATTEYTLKNLKNGDDLCVFVKAVQEQNGITAASNENCFKVKVIEPVDWIQAVSADVLPDNSVDLKWAWNANAEIMDAKVSEGNTTANIQSPTSYAFVAPPTTLNIYNFTAKNPSVSAVHFKIATTDICNEKKESVPISTIFLRGAANQDKTNTLNWEFPDQTGLFVKSYTIYKVINGVETILETKSSSFLQIVDEVDIDNPDEEKICYYVQADAQVELGDGSILDQKIRSNTVCINQFANLFFPNAIVPDGINNEFRPLSVFAQNAVYNLVIYDRWGQKVFETNDINKPWKGKKGNDALPAGLYVYYAKLTQPNGRIEERKGDVMLVR